MKRKNEGESGMEKKQDKKKAPDKHPWTFAPKKPNDNMHVVINTPGPLELKITYDEYLEHLEYRMKQSIKAAEAHADHLFKETGFRPRALNFTMHPLDRMTDTIRRTAHAFITTKTSGYWTTKNGFLFVIGDRIPWNKEIKPFYSTCEKSVQEKGLFDYPFDFAVYREKHTFLIPSLPPEDGKRLKYPDASEKWWNSPAAEKAGLLSRLAEGKLSRTVHHIFEAKDVMSFDDDGNPSPVRLVTAEVFYTMPIAQVKEIMAVSGKRLLDLHPLYKRALLAKAISNPAYGRPITSVPNVRDIIDFVQSKYTT